jgi:drug/metabolite transporter (DMT)-like permease
LRLSYIMAFIDLNKKIWQWLLLLSLASIWGTSFILMKRGLASYSNFDVAALRIFISFLFFLPLIIANLKKLSRQNFGSLLLVGFIGNLFPAFLFTTAQTQISSYLAGILNSLTPLFTLLVGYFFYRSEARFSNLIGLIIGLIGAVGLINNNGTNLPDQNLWFALFAVIATLFYGINVNEVKYKLKELDSVAIASLAFLFIGPLAGAYLLFTGFQVRADLPHHLESLGYITLLALFASVLAVIGINVLLKYTTALFASSVTYIIPVFAVFWGVLDGEPFHFFQVFWIALILLGVYLVKSKT